jgi:HlyD family secretion protein
VRKIISIIVVVALALAITFMSCGLIKGRKNNTAGENRIEVVRRGNFQMRISATGNLEPLIDVEVKSNVEGEIIKLYVKEGDSVEKDQVLIDIDPEQIQEEKKQAAANVAAARAQVEQARLNIHLKEEELTRRLQEAKDNLEIAKSNLLTVEAASRTQITQAETQIQTTENELHQDQIALEQAEIAWNQAKIRLAQLEADRDSAKVARDAAKAEWDRNKELYEKKLVSKKALEDAESRYASADSQYNNAEKQLESQNDTVSSQEKTIATRKSAINSREATLAYQKLSRDKLVEMRKAEEEQARLQLRIAQTRLDEIVRTIENERKVTEQSKASADANLLRAESNLKNQEERLGWTTIRAPMAGTVTTLEIEEGEIVTSGRSAFSQSPPLMTIADLSKMVVKTYINEVDMERLRLGQPAEIKVDAYQSKRYEGRVAEVAPSGVQRDNIITFEVMVEVIGSPPELRPGMSTDVDIITYEEKDVLILPIDAIQENKTITAAAELGDTGVFKENQEIELKTATGKSFKGKVTNVGASQLTISLDSSQRGVRPGRQIFAILVNGEQKADGVATTIEIMEEKFVMLDAGSGNSKNSKEAPKGKKTLVETGLQNETEVVIKSGVVEGDRVIVPPRATLQQPQWGRGG